jgi:hypothetical protein
MKKVIALLLVGVFLTSFVLAYTVTVKVIDNPGEANANANPNSITTENSGQGKVKINDQEIDSDLEIEGEEATDSAGNKHQIKITPQELRALIRNRLRIHNDSELKIQLRERTHNNVPRIVYNIETNENGKFLGIFKMASKATTEVDADTGEVLEVKRPWWVFLVRRTDDLDISGEPTQVCCAITPVVALDVDVDTTYELKEESECSNIGVDGEPIVGANYEIVEDALCESE